MGLSLGMKFDEKGNPIMPGTPAEGILGLEGVGEVEEEPEGEEEAGGGTPPPEL